MVKIKSRLQTEMVVKTIVVGKSLKCRFESDYSYLFFERFKFDFAPIAQLHRATHF